jgi:hypothetical protein
VEISLEVASVLPQSTKLDCLAHCQIVAHLPLPNKACFFQPVELGWGGTFLEVASVLPQIKALNWIAWLIARLSLVAMRSHLDKTSNARSRTSKKTRHWVKTHGGSHIVPVSQVPNYPLTPAAVTSCTDAGCTQLACVWIAQR